VEHLPETAGLILAYFYFLLAVFSPALAVWAVVRFLRDVRACRHALESLARSEGMYWLQADAIETESPVHVKPRIALSAFGR
jgi:hypothetical protein